MQASEQEEVRRVIGAINAAWLNGSAKELDRYFHRTMVVVDPEFRHLCEGREACIESYEDFLRVGTVCDITQSEVSVDIFEKTAVASYHFAITYEMDGKTYHESGRDVFVLIREAESWQAVWRTVIPAPVGGEQEREPDKATD